MKCASGCVHKTSAPVVAGSGAFFPGTGSALKKIVHAAEQERPDVAEAGQRWREDQPWLDPARLAVIDETGTSTNMTRLRGRGPRGARLVRRVPDGHWERATFVSRR